MKRNQPSVCALSDRVSQCNRILQYLFCILLQSSGCIIGCFVQDYKYISKYNYNINIISKSIYIFYFMEYIHMIFCYEPMKCTLFESNVV